MLRHKNSLTTFALLFSLASVPGSLAALPFLRPALAQTTPSVPTFSVPSALAADARVTIDGDSSMSVVNEALRSRFLEQFQTATVTVNEEGSEAALAALDRGDVDLAAIGRPLTDEEKAKGFVQVTLPREKIAIIVAPGNPYRGDISFRNFGRIFRGEVTNWSELQGAPAPIRFVDRPESSDTRNAFRPYPVFQEAPFQTGTTATAVNQDSTDAVIQALGNDGISYAPFSQVVNRPDVRIVAMHRTLPDDPRYPFSKPRYYVYKGTPTPATQAFLAIATSPQGTQLLEQAAAIATAAAAAPAATTTAPADATAPSPAGAAATSPTGATATSPTDAAAPSPTGATATSPVGTAPTDPAAAPGGEAAPVAPVATPAPVTNNSPWPWLALLGLAVLGVGGFLWSRSRRAAAPPAAPPATSAPIPPAAPPVPSAEPAEPPPPPAASAETSLASRAGSVIASDRAERLPTAAIATGAAAAVGAAALGAVAATRRSPQSRIILTPRNAEDAYAYWEAPEEHKAEVRSQGGQDLKLRLYDVTGRTEETLLPDTFQEYAVAEADVDRHLPIQPNRDYLVEVGYGAEGDRWLPLAKSNLVRVPAAPVEVPSPASPPPAPTNGLPGAAIAGAAAAGLGALAATALQREPAAALPSSRIILTPRDATTAYAYWEAPEAHKAAVRSQGGRDLKLRIYDVTGTEPTNGLPEQFQEYAVAEMDRDRHVPIAQLEHDYLAEIGYTTADGQWLTLAQSEPIQMTAPAAIAGGIAPAAAAAAAAIAPVDPGLIEPALPEPSIPEPVMPEPVIAEAMVPEPVMPEPVMPEPVMSEPIMPEPVLPLSLSDESVVVEPVGAEPVILEPVMPEPVIAEAVVPQPAIAEPAIVEPAIVEPAIAEPVVAEPAIAEPAIAEPVVAEPVAEPVVAEPAAAEAVPAEPAASEGVEPSLPGLVAGAAAVLGAGAAIAGLRDTDPQSTIEAAKFDVGQPDLSAEQLAGVDENLPELPDGYGESRIILLPRDPHWAYTYWDVPNEHRQELRQQGGERLALRLYDITDIDANQQRAHSMQQYDCDELARDWYLPAPVSDRDYRVEIGYLTADGRWLMAARSNPIRIPPMFPSDWYEDYFMTMDWDTELRGKTFIQLTPPGQRTSFDNPIYDEIFGLAETAEADRVAGSVFGSMQQVPGSGQMASGAALSSAFGSAQMASGAALVNSAFGSAQMTSGAALVSSVFGSAQMMSGAALGSVPVVPGAVVGSAQMMSGAALITSAFGSAQMMSGAALGSVPMVAGSAQMMSGAALGSVPMVAGSAQMMSGAALGSVPIVPGPVYGSMHMMSGAALGSVPMVAGSAQMMSGAALGSVPIVPGPVYGSMHMMSGAALGSVPIVPGPVYGSMHMMSGAALGSVPIIPGAVYGSMHMMSGAALAGAAISSYIFPSGVGMWAVPTYSGLTMSGVGFSASMPPERVRKFWLVADAELIVYGATEPDATVYINGDPIQLSADGTFRFRMSFPDGQINYPILAIAVDGEQARSIHMKFDRETPQRHTNTREEAQDEPF